MRMGIFVFIGQKKKETALKQRKYFRAVFRIILRLYLLTWNLVSPSLKKALICLAAAIPALMLASAV